MRADLRYGAWDAIGRPSSLALIRSSLGEFVGIRGKRGDAANGEVRVDTDAATLDCLVARSRGTENPAAGDPRFATAWAVAVGFLFTGFLFNGFLFNGFLWLGSCFALSASPTLHDIPNSDRQDF